MQLVQAVGQLGHVVPNKYVPEGQEVQYIEFK